MKTLISNYINSEFRLYKPRIILFLFLIPLVIIFFVNANNEGMSFDEAGQFWISKGQNHFTPLNKQNGDFQKMIENNNKYNLDPGGFTIILRFWTSISNHIIWLKLLPFLFFMIFVIYFQLLIILITKRQLYSIIGLCFLFCIDILFEFQSFIRPYSMEYCGAIICLYYLLKYKSSNNEIYLFTISLILGVFTWSRYTFIINIIAASILSFKVRSTIKNNLSIQIKLLTPSIISLIIIYIITLSKQNPTLKAPEFYFNTLILYNPKLFIDGIKMNFLNIRSASFILLCASYWSINHNKANSIANIPKDTMMLIKWSIIVHMSLLFFSIIGASPWNINDQRSAYLYIITLISTLVLVYIYFNDLIKIKKTNQILKLICIVFVLFISISKIGYKRSMAFYFIKKYNHSCMSLSKQEMPYCKYLFKYGELKESNTLIYNKINFTNNLFPTNNYPLIINLYPNMKLDHYLKRYKHNIITTRNMYSTFSYINYVVYYK